IRFEWAIGDTFNEKFTLTFEEKFCDGADWIRRRNAHSGGFLDHAEEVRKNFELQRQPCRLLLEDCGQHARRYSFVRASPTTRAVCSMSSSRWAVEINAVSNCDGGK